MNKIENSSLDITKMNIEKLKELFPNVVTEGKIDFDVLRTVLGDEVDDSKEKYQFTWHGKTKAIKLAQSPSIATLRPDKKSSKDWNSTENLYIEGDNLEVLKQLQKTYYGKIKMIYIDPPYNTGKDFVYHDDFKNSIENYKKQTKQFNKSNPDTSGRYHTDWLNLIYPRLLLAKNLLRNDGVIFISIDDNEVTNLRKICDEIFNQTNFITNIIWQKKTGASDSTNISTITEYVLVYSKNINLVKVNKNKSALDLNRYRYKDSFFEERGPFYYDSLDRGTLGYHESLDYGIQAPDGTMVFPNGRRMKKNDGWRWKWGKEKLEWGIKNGFVEIKKAENKTCGWGVYYKIYLNVDNDGNYIEKASPYKNLITNVLNTHAANESKALFGRTDLFSNPKPIDLIKHLVTIGMDKNDCIIDFFSGSSTTANSVMKLNAEDGGMRKYIMVQLPEVCDEKSVAYRAGYNNICEIGKERIRRAGEQIKAEWEKEHPSDTLFSDEERFTTDIGFKVFKLDSTNIRPWDSNCEMSSDDLFSLTDVFKQDRSKEDILYEIMLKYGIFDMPAEEIEINGKTMYRVGKRYMIVCLEDEITSEDVKAIAELSPKSVVFKESGFKNDNDKINAEYNLEKADVEDIKCI